MATLRIYVARHCPVSAEALRLAAEVERRFGHVSVKVIDIDSPGAGNADDISVVPAYVLDGRKISLGNPSEEALFTLLAATDRGNGK